MEQRTAVMGQEVVYVDPVGRAHPALVTAVWGPTCLNVVFVSKDETKRDSFGRQLERATSTPHASLIPVHGNYWRFTDETPKPTER